MGRIRPFSPDDIPAIVALRPKAFRKSERASAADLGAYLEQLFFRNPWRDPALPSLVYVEATGQVTGFLGVVPRPARFEGEPIRIAVGTQLMVDPAGRGFAGIELMRAFLSGTQDLSFADLAGDVSRKLWTALGASVSQLQSIGWTKPLRPSRFAAAVWARGRGARGFALGLRPLWWLLDAFAAPPLAPEGLQTTALTAAMLADHLADLLECMTLRPEYDEPAVRWLLEQLTAKRGLGELQRRAVVDEDGAVIGWWLYYANPRGVGQVAQVAARKGRYEDVLAYLFHDAYARGLTALAGRLEPDIVPALGTEGVWLHRDGPWALVHSPRPELVAAILGGEAFLSRLEGEWWMSF
jgi:hypothetical protein